MQQFRSYQLALSLSRRVHRLAKGQLPCHLKDQLTRAADSVVLTLAEGYGRISAKDQNRFFKMSLGSIREVQSVFDIHETDAELVKLADDVAKNVYCLARSLLR